MLPPITVYEPIYITESVTIIIEKPNEIRHNRDSLSDVQTILGHVITKHAYPYMTNTVKQLQASYSNNVMPIQANISNEGLTLPISHDITKVNVDPLNWFSKLNIEYIGCEILQESLLCLPQATVRLMCQAYLEIKFVFGNQSQYLEIKVMEWE